MTYPIHSIGVHDEVFPSRLLSISSPPSILHYLGNSSLMTFDNLVAIVGTRTPTSEGVDECQFITKWFIERGYCVVSGLALGIDTVVHETCLRNNGKTIAILPSGIGNIYPHENKGLVYNIVDSGGLILSEYPERISARKSNFIQRDRLQSAISSGVTVIESEITGGTMYTARFALKQNRLLGCVAFDDYSENRSGNKKLLSSGKAFGINRHSLEEFELLLKSSNETFQTIERV